MTTFDQEMDEVLLELLNEFGWTASISRAGGNQVFDRETLEYSSGTPETGNVEAVFFDPTTSSLSGFEQELPADHVLSRKWMLIRSTSIGVKSGDRLVSSDHGTFDIDKVTGVGPNKAIYYKVAAEKIDEPSS